MDIFTSLLFCGLYLLELTYVSGNTVHLTEGYFKPLFKPAVSEFSQHEIVHPRLYSNGEELLSTWTKNGHPEQLNVKFQTNKHNVSIQLLRNKNLFSKSYVEKSYTEGDKYSLRRPHHKKLLRHCFYHGHIEGAEHSNVALSTCKGVSGYIEHSGEVYHIEPAFDIDKNSHRLYRDVHSLNKPLSCGTHTSGHSREKRNEDQQNVHRTEYLKRRRRSIVQPYDSNINTRYVEMYIVNDFKTFDSNGRNLNYQIMKTQNIVNIVSKLYQPFNLYIVLVGIENWADSDKIQITNDADDTLQNFLHYRRSRINPYHPNDNSQFITGTSFTKGVVGKAIKGTICTFQYSGGVNLNLGTEGQTATTIAHELGHNFGMDHDNYTVCQCRDDKCIMAATSGGINTPTKWSSCSMASLQEAFEMGMDYCLRNIPDKLPDGPVCGNSFTEEGEECDCGSLQECRNRCCNATTCKLTAGAQCAAGSCCDFNTCKIKEAASLCRGSVGECDLPEFCRGNSSLCPDDVYVQDGVDCYSGQSYCYNGTCRTHTGQCRQLWGSTGRVSDPVCFKHLNSNGSKHGNCGYNWTTSRYVPCLRGDVMCGLLHCVHQNEKLMFWKDNLAHATPATFLTIGDQTYVCRGAMLDVGLDMPDPGMVPDGAKCGDHRMCVNRKCKPISYMNFASCPEGCSERGVCNSKGHCHCEEGWGAPICDVAGNGGSIDSGPIKIEGSNAVMIILMVLFLLVLPLIGLFGFLAYYFRYSIQAWWHHKFTNNKSKQQSLPLRPVHPPPKREVVTPTAPIANSAQFEPPPPYPGPARNQTKHTVAEPARNQAKAKLPEPARNQAKQKVSVKISNPVLTGSTNKHSQSHVQPSPVPDHKDTPPRPKLPTKATKQGSTASQGASRPLIKPADKIVTGEPKPKPSTTFKIPSFSKADRPVKPEVKAEEGVPAANIVKKRELTRDISNPILISTTDRRSKHLVLKNEAVHVNQSEANQSLVPPLPPHVSLTRTESENSHRNRPLPSRPLSMPDSECGDESVVPADSKKAAVSNHSPRMPQRPPPPPVKPHLENTRRTIQDELAKLDQIEITIPSEANHSTSAAKAVHPKTKDIKPKPRNALDKSVSGDQKKLQPPSKAAVAKSKSDTSDKPAQKPIQKPIFNPKARPGLSPDRQTSAIVKKIDKGKKPADKATKPSSDNTDADPTAASVTGLAKIFEGQKKPLLGDKNVARTKSNAAVGKTPLTPPKPKASARKIRSVDV